MTVKASSGPIEICKEDNCTEHAGGKGRSSGKLSKNGLAYIKVGLKDADAGSIKDAESEVECDLYGDEAACGVVDLSEVVATIVQWAEDEAALEDVIDLINAWGNT